MIRAHAEILIEPHGLFSTKLSVYTDICAIELAANLYSMGMESLAMLSFAAES
jgi:hypothetical protein